MKTKSERFVEQQRDSWQTMRSILLTIKKRSYSSLSTEEVDNFGRLYRIICADLARAKTLQLSPDILEYLNNLVGQAHNYLYGQPILGTEKIKDAFLSTIPKTVTSKWRYVILSMLFFLIPFICSYIICLKNKATAATFISQPILTQMEEAYSKPLKETRSSGQMATATAFYIQHNVSISFLSFAAGIFLGIGTIYLLIYNGLFLGAIAGYINALGYGKNFWHFVTAHSAFELTGLIIAGAAGLLLGYSILKGGRFRRRDQINKELQNIFSLIMIAMLLIIAAAFIEALLSPNPINYSIKISVFIFSLVTILYYFFVLPRKRGYSNENR